MIKAKKSVSFLMLIVLLLSSFTEAFAGTSLEEALNKVSLYVKEDGTQLLTWQGIVDADNFAAAYIVYKAEDGKEYPAYCGNPNRPGVDKKAGRTYDVDIDTVETNPQVWGVITNGHPYKTPQELGVRDEYEAYYITSATRS